MPKKSITIGAISLLALAGAGTYTVNLPITLDIDIVIEQNDIIKKNVKSKGHSITARGDLEVRGDIDGDLILSNKDKVQRLKVKAKKKIHRLIIGESPADVVLDSDLWVGDLIVNTEATLDTNGYNLLIESGDMIIDGTLDSDGSTITAHDVSFGSGSTFIKPRELVLSGTGHRITIPATYVQQATYSGSLINDEWIQNDTVLVSTGTLLTATGYTFTSYINVESILSGTGFELAVYSGSLLLPSSKPNIGTIPATYSGSELWTGTGWITPYWKPAVNLGIVKTR